MPDELVGKILPLLTFGGGIGAFYAVLKFFEKIEPGLSKDTKASASRSARPAT